ncbi:helix-turn-helix transcriptional regulator [Flavobacteriaceae bacterium S356]|uniref:Helix-turn-helix transcriptional regulator n=1 Tax=Asprobacillus argus TaxID=3076534 RepID=A0ABU3LEK8_9FLAO|nr:helix-turn-helix transcriptional regulator [Flavobacteriaceae bacterium S356]
MKTENVFIMKQPELGKKISELRKQKGFTQEELVEQCNINVRTIQRIEAGDVTPRSYTVRTILEALGVDTSIFFKESINEEEHISLSEKQKKVLSIAWISGIFFAIFAIVGTIVEFYLVSYYEGFNDGFFPRIAWNIPFLIALFFFLRGYKELGSAAKNDTLVTATYVYFIIEIVMFTIAIIMSIFLFEESIVEILSGVVIAMLFGVSEIILGVGILKLKDHLGSLTQVIGISKIVLGVMLITIFLAPVASILIIPVLILEIAFMYNALQKLS